MMIAGVVTQGYPSTQYSPWVKSYSVSYSTDSAQFKTYRELSGVDKVTFSYSHSVETYLKPLNMHF